MSDLFDSESSSSDEEVERGLLVISDSGFLGGGEDMGGIILGEPTFSYESDLPERRRSYYGDLEFVGTPSNTALYNPPPKPGVTYIPKKHSRVLTENSIPKPNSNDPGAEKAYKKVLRAKRYLVYDTPVDVYAGLPLQFFFGKYGEFATWIKSNWDTTSTTVQIQDDLIQPSFTLYAQNGDRLLGVISCKRGVHAGDERYDYLIVFTVVAKKYRKKGIGRLLVEALEFYLSSKDKKIDMKAVVGSRAFSNGNKDRSETRFYEHLGYTARGDVLSKTLPIDRRNVVKIEMF